MWFVYIIKCKDNSLYTGVTNDLQRRFQEHKEGRGAKYTASHKPVKLEYFEEFENRSKSLKREIEIKKLTHRKKKDLIKSSIS